ncbi:hypothetical protein SDJN03_17191, partial [Cucurbita argyrosperma subsp. sororia]
MALNAASPGISSGLIRHLLLSCSFLSFRENHITLTSHNCIPTGTTSLKRDPLISGDSGNTFVLDIVNDSKRVWKSRMLK